MTRPDPGFRRFTRQLWCVYCLCEVGGNAQTGGEYFAVVARYSAGLAPCPACGRASEPMGDVTYAQALVVGIGIAVLKTEARVRARISAKAARS